LADTQSSPLISTLLLKWGCPEVTLIGTAIFLSYPAKLGAAMSSHPSHLGKTPLVKKAQFHIKTHRISCRGWKSIKSLSHVNRVVGSMEK
jgi:hypothetical protein